MGKMRLDLVDGRNAGGLGWYQNCSCIGLVAEMQLVWDSKNWGWIGLMDEIRMDWAGGRNAVGLVRCHKCSWIGLEAQMPLSWDGGPKVLDWVGGTNAARLFW